MMVDDDPIMIEVVQTYLEEAGYTSFVTTSEPQQKRWSCSPSSGPTSCCWT